MWVLLGKYTVTSHSPLSGKRVEVTTVVLGVSDGFENLEKLGKRWLETEPVPGEEGEKSIVLTKTVLV